MIRRSQQLRPAVTLTEVLIAIFVMALGILAIMALFPLGAVQMAQSVKDERTSTLAANAETMARIFWREAWQLPGMPGGLNPDESQVIAREPFIGLLDAPPSMGRISGTSSSPSYPVFVDPIGQNTWPTGLSQTWVGYVPSLGSTSQRLVRGNWAMINNTSNRTAAALRLTSVLDDMSFNDRGQADISSGFVDRGARFSCAWLFQRRKNNIRSEVNLTVVVYHNRPPAVTPTPEEIFNAEVRNFGTEVRLRLNHSGSRPELRRGRWIADVSWPADAAGNIEPRADFYRILDYTDNNDGTYTLELDAPVRRHPNVNVPIYDPTNPAAGGTYTGQFLILDNVAEVFERGTISAIMVPAY